MEFEPLNVLVVSHDEPFAQGLAEMLRGNGESTRTTRVPALEAGLTELAAHPFQAVLFELPSINAAGLFQVTRLTVKFPRVPVVVFGPEDQRAFALEIIRSGAQDYLTKAEIKPDTLRHTLRSAVERHQERLALRDERDNYFGVFDHLVEGVFRTTPDGHYLLANVALARIYGYESPLELMASIQDIATRLYVAPGRREEFIRVMREKDTITDFESEIYRKDNSVIWISENCRAVRDARGTLLYYEGTVQDITQRRQAEQALRKSESLYHSLVETLPQSVFRKDREGRYTFANHQCGIHYNCRPEEIPGKTDFDFFPKELAEKYRSDDQQVLETGQMLEVVEDHHPFGQERSTVQMVKTPLYDTDGKMTGLQGIFWDITEKRRAEEQIRRTTAELARSREELRVKNHLMEDNLQMAREIQMAMLPQQYPVFPANASPDQSAFQFVHRYQATETVSGDFFSVSALSDTEAAVFICDVTGHGTRAALVTAMIRALTEELKPLAREPGHFLRQLNFDLHNILKSTGSPMLTTAFYLVADWQTGRTRFANAGHPRPLVVRRSTGRIDLLAHAAGRGEPALGLFDNAVYQTSETAIVPGDLVMLFTDGLYEVQGLNEELYSQERLILDVQNLRDKPAAQMFDQLLEAIRAFSVNHEFEDDVCLVGMEFAGRPAAS